MKLVYQKPALRVVMMQPSVIMTGSDWDKMGPGENNQPAGSRRSGGSAWDDVEDWEEECITVGKGPGASPISPK